MAVAYDKSVHEILVIIKSGPDHDDNCLFQYSKSGLKVLKLFSRSAHLSMKFQLLINVEIVKNCGKIRFKTQKQVNYPARKC